MEPVIKLYADFNNADRMGRLRLTMKGTREDINLLNLTLTSGLQVMLDDNESLRSPGVVQFSQEENIWVAVIDWDNITNY